MIAGGFLSLADGTISLPPPKVWQGPCVVLAKGAIRQHRPFSGDSTGVCPGHHCKSRRGIAALDQAMPERNALRGFTAHKGELFPADLSDIINYSDGLGCGLSK